MTASEPHAVVPAVRPLNPKVVALGGGHGLFASLSALRRVTRQLTAIVTVADNGGSSGVLRRDFGVLPPGDLRMALAALCGDDAWGTTWSRVVQHRFSGGAGLGGHAVGNVLIVALWELLGDTIEGLDWVGRLLGAHGRVLPMAAVPLDLAAEVEGADPDRPDEISIVHGQVACASTTGRVRSVALIPADPPACPEAVEAIGAADWVVLAHHAPNLAIDVVLADRAAASGSIDELEKAASRCGARLVLADLAVADGSPRHDALRLAGAFARIFEGD